MRCFVLFREEVDLRAAMLSFPCNIPNAISFDGRKFELLEECLGNFNHLISDDGELVGFEFPLAGEFLRLHESPLIKKSRNVRVDDAGALQIILCDEKPFHSDEVLGIGNWIYRDRQSDYILLVPEITDWGKLWNAIAFEIRKDGIPIPA